MPNRRAFTLSEVLVVFLVISVLSALLFPVFSSAKRSAKTEASKQYLKQQYIAIELYSQENEGILPSWSTLQNTQRLHAPCSPNDNYWIMPCWHRSSPMVGSFGYAVAVNDLLDEPIKSMSDVRPLLADPFATDYKLGEFSGDAFPNYPACLMDLTCYLPARISFIYTDGGLRIQKNAEPPRTFSAAVGHTRVLFGWSTVFNRQDERDHAQRKG